MISWTLLWIRTCYSLCFKEKQNIKILTYEINPDYIQILQLLFPSDFYKNIDFIFLDFLKNYPEKQNFDLIFYNPPFGYLNDNFFYYDFFFKCLDLFNSKNKFYFIVLI